MRKKIGVLFLFLFGFLVIQAQNQLRVVSLAPSITENIYSLGGNDLLVGCTDYCMEAVADKVDVVGSAVDINVEKIFSLKPDLVLTMELTNSRDLEAMRKLGLNVIILKSPKDFNEICEQTRELAKRIGKLEEAKLLIEQTKAEVAGIQTSLPGGNKKRKIFFQLGTNPVFTVLENTFMNDFIIYCNGENIARGLKHGTITREAVLLKNPDVIIIATMGGFGEEEKQIWQQYKSLEAVKKGQVFLVSSETSCSPTPENFARALDEIAKKIKD